MEWRNPSPFVYTFFFLYMTSVFLQEFIILQDYFFPPSKRNFLGTWSWLLYVWRFVPMKHNILKVPIFCVWDSETVEEQPQQNKIIMLFLDMLKISKNIFLSKKRGKKICEGKNGPIFWNIWEYHIVENENFRINYLFARDPTQWTSCSTRVVKSVIEC